MAAGSPIEEAFNLLAKAVGLLSLAIGRRKLSVTGLTEIRGLIEKAIKELEKAKR